MIAKQENRDRTGQIPTPLRNHRTRSDRRNAHEIPDDEPIDAHLPDEELPAPDLVGVGDSPANEENIMADTVGNGQTPCLGGMEEEAWGVGVVYYSLVPGHQLPAPSYVCRGSALCRDYARIQTRRRFGPDC